MKYKYLYRSDDLDAECNYLFGPLKIAKNYVFSKNSDGANIIIPSEIQDDDFLFDGNYYGEINDYAFFDDIINYGEQFYSIFKGNLKKLKLDCEYPTIITEDILDKNINHIKKVCLKFMKDYLLVEGIDNKRIDEGTTISFIINHILVIYSIETIRKNLSNGFKKFSDVYEAFGITRNIDNSIILYKLRVLVIKLSNPKYHMTSFYHGTINAIDNLILINYTNNIFSLAFQVLQYNFATNTYDSENGKTKFSVFRRCAQCQKIFEESLYSNSEFKMLKCQKKYCKECSKERKKISSNKYEHEIRKIYDELKGNINKCSPKLADKIRHLPSRDKVSIKYLRELHEELKKK